MAHPEHLRQGPNWAFIGIIVLSASFWLFVGYKLFVAFRDFAHKLGDLL